MKINMLGTGSALVTEYFNTCFTITADDGQVMLVDGGGGNELLRRLKAAEIRWQDIHHIFITHKHIDHILGLVWMIRLVCQNAASGKYQGKATIYANEEVVGIFQRFCQDVLPKKQHDQIGKALFFVTLHDGDTHEMIGHRFQFFDIGSTKADQMGFAMSHKGISNYLCCLGDEPYNAICEKYVKGCQWMMHEAFCLFTEADIHKPYEKHHSTVKDACSLASELNVPNVILYHTEGTHLSDRKVLYTAEGRKYYNGHLLVPEDMEVIEI